MSAWLLPLLCIIAADDPAQQGGESEVRSAVVLVCNTTRILERDHLLLLTKVDNGSLNDISIMESAIDRGQMITYHVKGTGPWRMIPSLKQVRQRQFGENLDRRRERVVAFGTSYVEYDVILRLEEEFVFETAGQYQIQAAIQTSDGVMTSNIVKIVVDARSEEARDRIAAVAGDLKGLELISLSSPITRKLSELADVGGNVGRTLAARKRLEEYVKSQKVHGALVDEMHVAAAVRPAMDEVHRRYCLELLGQHFLRWGNVPAMRSVLADMPYDSLWRREIKRNLRARELTKSPAEWVRQDYGGAGLEILLSD